jgi:deoxyribonucleoside regulator
MYYLDELGQQEIADILGVSRTRVSRALSEARDEGIVRISVADYEPRDGELETRLRDRYGLRQAFVVKTVGRATENVRRTVGYYGAPGVSDLVGPEGALGVAGGRTLRELISFMTPREWVRNATVVQLMGNTGPNPTQIDALELSRVLAQRFEGSFFTLNAPAFAQDSHTRDVFLAHEHIRMIWSIFDSLHLALVGIGSVEDSVFVERGALEEADLARLRELGAVGEICGRFFDAAGEECVTEYRDRVISIDLDTLRRCREVVAVTNGTRRTAATKVALMGRLVTSLVIDDRGAEALLA